MIQNGLRLCLADLCRSFSKDATPGPLTEQEWTIMRRHPVLGQYILKQAGGVFELLSHIVVAHHERWDGDSYPYGLVQNAIPLGARIIAVVDAYDAMVSQRPYRHSLTATQARAELRHGAGSQFDPEVVEAFLDVPRCRGTDSGGLSDGGQAERYSTNTSRAGATG